MASPSETTLILLGAAAADRSHSAAIRRRSGRRSPRSGLTITPLLAKLGRLAARRVDPTAEIAGRTMQAQGPDSHLRLRSRRADGRRHAGRAQRPYLAVDSDIDNVIAARQAGYDDPVRRCRARELVDKLQLGRCGSARPDDGRSGAGCAAIARRVRSGFPDLPIIARARDTDHAAKLYEPASPTPCPKRSRRRCSCRRPCWSTSAWRWAR